MIAVAKIDSVARFSLLAYATVLGFSRAGIHTAVIILSLIFLCRYLRQPFRIEVDERLSLAMKVFFGAMLLSTLLSSDPVASAKYLGTLAFRFLPFFIVLAFVHEEKFLQRAVVFMAGSLTVGSIVGIYQGLHGASRAKSFLGQMDFGGILGLIIPLLIIQGLENRTYKPWQTKLLFVASFLGCIALMFNGTRAVWVSVSLCLVLIVIIMSRRNAKILVASVVLMSTVMAIGLNSPRIMERANTLFDKNYRPNVERIIMWEYGWKTFLEHPISGIGLAALPTHPSFISPEVITDKPLYGHVHNNFLQMLAENGIIGFCAFSFLFGNIIYTGFRSRYDLDSSFGLTAAICTIGFLIHGLFDYTLNIATVIYSYWFILGLVYTKYRIIKS